MSNVWSSWLLTILVTCVWMCMDIFFLMRNSKYLNKSSIFKNPACIILVLVQNNFHFSMIIIIFNRIVNYSKIFKKTIVSFFLFVFNLLKMRGYQLGSTCRTKFCLEWWPYTLDRLVEGRPARLMSWTSIVGTAIPIKFGPLMLCIFLIQAFCLDIVWVFVWMPKNVEFLNYYLLFIFYLVHVTFWILKIFNSLPYFINVA